MNSRTKQRHVIKDHFGQERVEGEEQVSAIIHPCVLAVRFMMAVVVSCCSYSCFVVHSQLKEEGGSKLSSGHLAGDEKLNYYSRGKVQFSNFLNFF